MKWVAALLFFAASLQADETRLTSHKIVHLGDITYASGMQITKEMMAYDYEDGPIFVFIDSTGGLTEVGKQIITLMEAMKTRGDRFVCMVTGQAYSMAFNILTHCDTRLAAKQAKLLFHKIRYGLYMEHDITAKKLIRDAAVLLEDDKHFDGLNAKALGLTPEEYDKYADAETYWTAKALLKRGYLHGYITSDEDDQFIGPPAPKER